MSKRSEIRGTWKQVAAGRLVALLMRVLGLTLRYRVDDPSGQKIKAAPGVPVIWAFWHNCLFAAPLTKTRFSGAAPASALASASRDGAVIESMVTCFGVKTVRGSSSRRGVAALIALKKALKAGEQLFITPDGPRGPRYHLQPGVVKLAQSSGAPIIPVRFSHSSSWRLKSWDRFYIPKPFSEVVIRVGEAIHVPAKLDENDFESYRQKVENSLREGVNDIPNND
ncbi:MAG: lysophospholipid acyltransferase family protein [Verrucomicrobiae bacterium]|nr:lysophospholipid acyltransferase family protein [Verrucomicrobiae bacterium]NNJ43409.1 lysophospholipid acyltransferase family protein [Akkermansiaceae bacterium]